jgi:hypothetical protein
MQYPHWLMVAGGVLVVIGFIGLAFRQNRYGAAADERNHDGDIEANGK